MAFDQTAYKNEYQRKNYDKFLLLLPKGRKQQLKDIAAMRGVSVNALIIEALEQYYQIDLSK